MRTFYIKEKGFRGNSHFPFWRPWGPWGCLWRVSIFLLFLLLFLFLLSMLRQCNEPVIDPLTNKPILPYQRPDSLVNNQPNVPSEPADSYVMPLHEPGDVITNPEDSTSLIVGNHLNIFLKNGDENVMNQFIEKFKRLYPNAEYEVIYKNPATSMLIIKVPTTERSGIKRGLNEQMPDFDFIAFDNTIFGESYIPKDPGFDANKMPEQIRWYFKPIQAYEAWDITRGSSNIKVAIIDSQFDLSHDELKDKMVINPYNVIKENNDVSPVASVDPRWVGHGTHVASLAVGTMDNNSGLSGIAPECSLIPICVFFDDPNRGTTSIAIMAGIMYALNQGADVVNISIGKNYPQELHKQISLEKQLRLSKALSREEQMVWDYICEKAEQQRTVLVFAAGNSTLLSGMDASKRNSNTIRVSAVDQNIRATDFTNYGCFNYDPSQCYSTLSAPGKDIVSAIPGNNYYSFEGTSQAAPIVAGAVALLKSLEKSLSTDEIITILRETGKKLNPQDNIGNLIQIKDALVKLKSTMLDYDEIFRNPESLLGWWACTDGLINTITTEHIDDYFEFVSLTRANTYTIESISKKHYKGIASVTIDKARKIIKMVDVEPLRCAEDGSKYNMCTYSCKSDKQGKLLVTARRGDGGEYSFKLRKVKKIEF